MPVSNETWLDAVEQVVAAVSDSDVSEFELRSRSFHVRVKRNARVRTLPLGAVGRSMPAEHAEDANLHKVVAPLTGVFYRTASPTAKAYVEPGEWVGAETVIGLIETMKVFNEVTADTPGRVVAFHAENGQLVHAGDLIATMEPGERHAADPDRESA